MKRRSTHARVSLLVGLLAATSVLATSAEALGRTRWVDDDGRAGAGGCGSATKTFRKVQPAIDASGVGDVIRICPGVYRQNLLISGVEKNFLRLRGVTPGAAQLRASAQGGSAPFVRIVDTEGIVLSDLVLGAPTARPCRRVPTLVEVDVAGAQVERSTLQPFGTNTVGPCGFETGVEIKPGSSVGLDRVVVRDFRVTGVLARDSEAIVEDSDIRFFHAKERRGALRDTGTVGLYGRDDAKVFFRRNTIGSLRSGGRSTPLLESGIKIYNAMNDPLITANVVRTVFYGFAITSTDGVIRRNDLSRGRRLLDFESVGISLSGGERNEVDDNRVRGFDVGIRIDGGATDNLLDGNDFRDNRITDCLDETTGGGGTSGTSNFWTANRGRTDSPNGLCAP